MSDDLSRYLDHLPMLYRDDRVLGKFLLAFEYVLAGGEPTRSIAGLEEIIERLDRFVRPSADSPADAAPAEFLPWLASWVGFALRHEWSEPQRRQLLARARWFHDRRGTAEGLKPFLELGLAFPDVKDVTVDIDEPDAVAGFFVVVVHPGTRTPAGILRACHVARWIIDRERPAHTWYRLHVKAPGMRIVSEPTPAKPGIRVGRTLLGSDMTISSDPQDLP